MKHAKNAAKHRAKHGAKEPPSLSDVAAYERERDRGLKVAALQARQRGEKPTAEQVAGWRRHDKREDHEARWRHYRTVPKGDYIELSGRQTKVLHEQAERYGLPLRARVIDLQAVLSAFHGLLARYGAKLVSDEDDPLLAGVSSPALEEYRRERAKLAKLDRLERERTLVERADIQEMLAPLASMLRSAGETIERRYGADAAAILGDTLDDFERDLGAWISASDGERE